MSKLNENNLPPISDFYNKLKDEECSELDYAHACKVWEIFDIKTLGDYHDLYMMQDVLLICDIFENFRNISLSEYRLDPGHYVTAPGLAWDAALKKTGVVLDLISDIDMHQMIESGIRGGVAMITHRYARREVNSSEIIYFDCNNLYGWSMSQQLPVGNFKWLDDIPQHTITYDYIAEVDLEYPDNLHNLHNDYPLAPETINITLEMLSPYCANLLKSGSKISSKLIPHLGPRKKYVVHGQTLRQYLDLGMQLTKVHRVLGFEQRAWLKPYIDLNTRLRTNSTTEFDKDFYKLMNNSVFGKSLENVRKHQNFVLTIDSKSLRKHIAKPSYKTHHIFHETLIGVSKIKTLVHLNKPIYTGQAILDISKTRMYAFHYNEMQKLYNFNNMRLLFTDTDSLCYLINTVNLSGDLSKIKSSLDTSNYKIEHELYTDKNKKVIGKFKDECGGKKIVEFVGLRAKCYSFEMEDGDSIQKSKGIRKNMMSSVRHGHYVRTLKNLDPVSKTGRQIRSHHHILYTTIFEKLVLSPYDDKRWILPDGVSTLSYGHNDISSPQTPNLSSIK